MRNRRGEMEILTIETPTLGDRSYVVVADGWAIVIDPQRDIDRVEELLVRRGVRLGSVLETHFHNDYITGGLTLARSQGAEYVVPSGPAIGFDARRIGDGASLRVGPLEVRVIDSAGHTDAHMSYEVRIKGEAHGVAFTGGSLLLGGTGRTDLLGGDRAEELARKQYRSVRRLGGQLPPATLIYPTHGFGSFCSAGPIEGGGTTLTEQLRTNMAFTTSEDDFVATVLSRLSPFPSYFGFMGPRNTGFPVSPRLDRLKELRLADVAALAANDRTRILDVRAREFSAAAHLEGSLCIDGSGPLASWFGWIAPIDQPTCIIAGTEQEAAAAQRELMRIGVDFISGAHITPGFSKGEEHGALKVASTPRASFADLAVRLKQDPAIAILDVRESNERATSHIAGSLHIAAHQLPDADLTVLQGKEVWTHCGAGFRSTIAASLLERRGVRSTIVDDRFFVAKEAGLQLISGEEPQTTIAAV